VTSDAATGLPSPASGDLVATLRAAGCVFAEDEARLLLAQAGTPAELDDLVRRRVAGEPLEQVLGSAEFRGLRVAVEPGVFVPRRRTGLLVDVAVRAARRVAPPRVPVVVDLCCGSGAVAAAVAAELVGRVALHAADVDPAAVACARRNLDGRAQVHQGDLFAALPSALQGELDVVVACTPYVPTAEVGLMPPEARDHEPLTALDGGADGLDVVRRLLAGAPGWLRAGGFVAVETGDRQAEPAAEAFTRAGLVPSVVTDDDLGATVVTGVLTGAVSEGSTTRG
jgi:release factor glutamine methyltransferase